MEASTEDMQECRAVIVDITACKQTEDELTIINKELLFQNEEKEKRAAELAVATKNLSIKIKKNKNGQQNFP